MPKHILLVDDQESMRTITRQMLESSGFKVTEADDGAAGLALYQEDPSGFDLILSDVNMPKLDGFELLRLVKEEHLEMPVVLLTGVNDKVVETVSNIYKADGVIKKPFQVNEALAVINKLI